MTDDHQDYHHYDTVIDNVRSEEDDGYSVYVARDLECDENVLMKKTTSDDDGGGGGVVVGVGGGVLAEGSVAIGDELGRGAFGIVYRAKWRNIDVAVKTLDYANMSQKLHISSSAANEAFDWEAQMMNDVRHPYVIRYFGRVVSPPQMIMKFCKNGTLHDFMTGKQQQQLSVVQWIPLAWRACAQLAEGLSYLHTKMGIIHRDIKLDNVLLDENMVALWSDLGVAQMDCLVVAHENSVVQSGIRDVRWQSPEECRGVHATVKSDVFSFGLLMWCIFSRRAKTWESVGADVRSIVRTNAENKVAMCHEFDSDAHPVAIRNLIKSCWSHEPDERPSAGELATALWSLRSDIGLSVDECATTMIAHHTRHILYPMFHEFQHFMPPWSCSRDLTPAEWRHSDTSVAQRVNHVIDEFLNDSKLCVLALIGDGGLGKSLTLYDMMNRYVTDDDTVLFVHLRAALSQRWSYSGLENDSIKHALREFYQLTDTEIVELQRNNECRKVVFLVDALDELQADNGSALRLPKMLKLRDEWPHAKVVVTCRRVIDNSEYTNVFGSDHRVVFLQPFREDDVAAYVNSYEEPISLDRLGRDTNQLLSNPFVLRLLVQCWPTLLSMLPEHMKESSSSGSSGIQIMKRHIYEASLIHWFRHSHTYLTPTVKLILQGDKYKNVFDSFVDFASEIALCMLVAGCASLRTLDVNDDSPWLRLQNLCDNEAQRVFDTSARNQRSVLTKKQFLNLRRRQVSAFWRECPLQWRLGGGLAFAHKSLTEFFSCKAFVLSPSSTLSRLIIKDKEVLQFAAEFVGNDAVFTRKLWECVKASVRDEKHVTSDAKKNASSNAASILNVSGVPFSGRDLSGGCFAHSYLVGSIFDSCKLQGCCFDFADMQQACLDNCDFTGASFLNTKFGELPSLKNFAWSVACMCMTPRSVGAPPAATTLYVASDRTVTAWNVDTGERCSIWYDHAAIVHALAISHDGNVLASADFDGVIMLRSVAEGKCRQLIGHTAAVKCLIFDQHGSLYSSSTDRTVRVWSMNSRKCLHVMDGQHTGSIEALALSSCATMLWSAGRDGTICEWRMSSSNDQKPMFIRRYSVEDNADVWCVAVSDDDRNIFCGAVDGFVYQFSADSGSLVRVFKGHEDSVSCLLLTDSWLVTGSWDHSIGIFSLSSGELLNRRNTHIDDIYDICLCHDGSLYSCGRDRKVRQTMLNVNRPMRVGSVEGHSSGVYCLELSSDGNSLYSGSHDHTLRQWATNDGRLIKTMQSDERVVTCIALRKDRNTIFAGHDVYDGGAIVEWDCVTGQVVSIFRDDLSSITSLCVSADGQYLFSGHGDGCMKQTDLRSQQIVNTVELKAISDIVLSDSCVAYVCGIYGACAYSSTTQEILVKFTDKDINCVTLSPCQQYLYGGGQHKINKWSVDDGALQYVVEFPTDFCFRIIVTEDDSLFAAGGASRKNGIICHYKLSDDGGKMVAKIRGHAGWVSDLELSVDGKCLYTASGDHSIHCYSIRPDHQHYLIWSTAPRHLSAHDSVWNGCHHLSRASQRLVMQIGGEIEEVPDDEDDYNGNEQPASSSGDSPKNSKCCTML